MNTVQPLNFGKDSCHFCSMTILDKKFGAELINNKGKTLRFDSGECMIRFLNSGSDFIPETYLIVNYAKSGELIAADQAFYLKGGSLNSPMGGALAAFKTKDEAEQIQKESGGDLIYWETILHLRF